MPTRRSCSVSGTRRTALSSIIWRTSSIVASISRVCGDAVITSQAGTTRESKPVAPISDPYQMYEKLYGQLKDKESLRSVVDDLQAELAKGDVKELPIIIKADV